MSRAGVPADLEPLDLDPPGRVKGRVKSIPKADRGISKRVSQIVLKMSGKFIQSGFGK